MLSCNSRVENNDCVFCKIG